MIRTLKNKFTFARIIMSVATRAHGHAVARLGASWRHAHGLGRHDLSLVRALRRGARDAVMYSSRFQNEESGWMYQLCLAWTRCSSQRGKRSSSESSARMRAYASRFVVHAYTARRRQYIRYALASKARYKADQPSPVSSLLWVRVISMAMIVYV